MRKVCFSEETHSQSSSKRSVEGAELSRADGSKVVQSGVAKSSVE